MRDAPAISLKEIAGAVERRCGWSCYQAMVKNGSGAKVSPKRCADGDLVERALDGAHEADGPQRKPKQRYV